jgi:pSer/pThr/pTyr-binding forkhead associated (FHA) protein
VYIVVVEDERGALVGETALLEGSLSIGRTAENDLVLNGATISRHHARLTLDGLQAVIADQGSANGVLVDDRPIGGPTAVSESSRIRIGEFRLYLERATGRMRPAQDGLSTAIVNAEQAHGKLVITAGAQAGRELMLFERIVCVGRTDENDITLADTSVSRHHARLKLQDDGSYTLTDLNSSNGTHVGGRRVASMRVQHGTRIHFGNVECLLLDPRGKSKGGPDRRTWVIYGIAVALAAAAGVLASLVIGS